MAAEFVWPLALAYALPIAGNPYYQQPAIKEWAEAGILYAARSAHADGSCDDYFPFEKAAGAAAFSLLAAWKATRCSSCTIRRCSSFSRSRADWLADHHESGRLTNHQALIVLCLEKCGRLFASDRWDKLKGEAAAARAGVAERGRLVSGIRRLRSRLPHAHHRPARAALRARRRRGALKAALEKAIRFAAHFVHPDGSFGGEYTSRNTYNFFPHGFEIAATGCRRRWRSMTASSPASSAAWALATRTITSSAITPGATCSRGSTLIAERPPPPAPPEGRQSFQKRRSRSSSGAAPRSSISR